MIKPSNKTDHRYILINTKESVTDIKKHVRALLGELTFSEIEWRIIDDNIICVNRDYLHQVTGCLALYQNKNNRIIIERVSGTINKLKLKSKTKK